MSANLQRIQNEKEALEKILIQKDKQIHAMNEIDPINSDIGALQLGILLKENLVAPALLWNIAPALLWNIGWRSFLLQCINLLWTRKISTGIF